MEKTTPTIVSQSVKFSDEENKELVEIKSGFDKATTEFGRLYLQKIEIDKIENSLKKEYSLLEKQEKEFFTKIVTKYGEGTYDPKTNIFTPQK